MLPDEVREKLLTQISEDVAYIVANLPQESSDQFLISLSRQVAYGRISAERGRDGTDETPVL